MSALIPVEIFQDVIIIWYCPNNPSFDGKVASRFRYFRERFITNFTPFIGETIHKNKKEYKVEKVSLYVDNSVNEKITNDIKFIVDTFPEIYYVDYYKYLIASNANPFDPKNNDITTIEVPGTLEKWKDIIKIIGSIA